MTEINPDQFACPHEDPDCDPEDPRARCDGCNEDTAREHAQSFMDTFD